MSFLDQENKITCYQDLVLLECEKVRKLRFEDKSSRLTIDEVRAASSKYGISSSGLVSEGLLIEYPDLTFRTMHMDLIYRAVNVKSASWSPKLPLEFVVPPPRVDYLPSFDEVPLSKLKEIGELHSELLSALLDALKESGYLAFAFHQIHYLKELLQRKNKCYLLVSPTASGKSLVFYLPIIIDALKRLDDEPSTKGLVLFPRKALASDQLLKFMKVISILNDKLERIGKRKITIAIDDGDTPRSADSPEVRNLEVFRGVRCPRPGCSGQLAYSGDDKAVVTCKSCSHVYDEILATKEDIWKHTPDIVISNLSALNRRMMMSASQNTIGSELKWIVLDDAHVYREELGGHAYWLLQRLQARYQTLIKGDICFVISSATIPNPLEFTAKLIGLSKTQIHHEPFEKVIERSEKKFRKISLNLILAPNPLRSAEALAEELSLLLGVWGFQRSKKTVLFIDNTSEVERLYNFVVNTIILDREEQNDHVDVSKYPKSMDITNPFSWTSVTGTGRIDSLKLSKIYDYHYADLSPELRAKVEERFKSQKSGVLFSTSTLELGIDIGDIAAIIQYKVPLTSESYTQRFGWGGRSRETFRIALGVLVLTNSPSQVRYVLGNEYLRLIDPTKIDPDIQIPVAYENEEIKKQHMTYAILDVLAAMKDKTYLNFKEEIMGSWTKVTDALSALKDVCEQAKKHSSALEQYAKSAGKDIDSVKFVQDQNQKIQNRIKYAEGLLASLEPGDVKSGIDKLHSAEHEVAAILVQVQKTRDHVYKTYKKLPLKELDEYRERLQEVENTLTSIMIDLERIWEV